MKLAAIDVGTNSVLLTVAEQVGGSLRPVQERAEITRLGRGVDRTRALSTDGIDATLRVLASFANEARTLGVSPDQVACVATSAARDATNGAGFLRRVTAETGLVPEIIDGLREARLMFLAARTDFGEGDRPLAVVDLGGGSTEIAIDLESPGGFSRSLEIGSVRLYERHGADRAKVAADIDAALQVVPRIAAGTRVVGIAGTWTTLAALSLGLADYQADKVHGHRLSTDAVSSLADRLFGMSLEQRLALPGLQPGRADVIQVGALIAAKTLARLGATEAIVSDRGVRWGLLYEKASHGT